MIFITWLLGGAVPTKQTIKTYEYKSPPLSLCERLFLDKFWSALPGTVYPLWLAPNVITLAGLACIVLAVALVLHHSPALEGAAPPWVYASVGVLLFAYQTLDGSDGKQARATGTGSALGELFDHGVDSVTVVLIAVCVQDAARVGHTDPIQWFCVAASTCTFYLSNCSLVSFGRQQFFDVDVQELIVCLTVWCLFCGVYGATAAPRWMILVALTGMVLNCVQLVYSLRATDQLQARVKALMAVAGGLAMNAITVDMVAPAQPFFATVPLVCCAAAAAGDLSRRLLLQRIADLPEVTSMVTPTGALLWALALWRGRTRCLVAAASLALYGVASFRTVAATADALGVRALTVPTARRSMRVLTPHDDDEGDSDGEWEALKADARRAFPGKATSLGLNSGLCAQFNIHTTSAAA